MNKYRLRTNVVLVLLGFCCATLAVGLNSKAGGDAHGKGLLPLRLDRSDLAQLAGDEVIEVAGRVGGHTAAHLVLRIDDARSSGYADRYNQERVLAPGDFRWSVPVAGLRTPAGRRLDVNSLARIMLFAAAGSPDVSAKIAISKPQRLPNGAKGYALGAADAPLPSGFERIAPGDARIERGAVSIVRRPNPDPLVANGLKGVERLKLPWSGVAARVTLWLEDPGEWELLPHPTERRVRINGQDVLSHHMTEYEWMSYRYLRGRTIEHMPTDDAWSAYGRYRGDMISQVVPVRDGSLVIELAGAGPDALHLSAILVEPDVSTNARSFAESERAEWYRSTWPVLSTVPRERPRYGIKLDRKARHGHTSAIVRRTAPGAGLRLTLAVESDVTITSPLVAVRAPAKDGTQLMTQIWAGQYRLARPRANATWLVRNDDMLVDPDLLPIRAGEVRQYELWIEVPADTSPGSWHGTVLIGQPANLARIPLTIDVLDVLLPVLDKPVGFYLDEAPHTTWFGGQHALRAAVIVCDLNLMRRLGIEGSAPALSTPRPTGEDFHADLQRARNAGVKGPLFAYAPAKRLLAELGIEGSAARIRDVEATAPATSPLLWAVADEPSNPDAPGGNLPQWIEAIRRAAPKARIAAQLNSPSDLASTGLFDVVLVNDGFGIDRDQLKTTRARTRGQEVWIYNSGEPRLTAGYWLWHTAASRYLQWHARMPTADPFDPTDGREGDVQMVYPSLDACPQTATIHRDLLDMADGIVDQRWLAWLAAHNDQRAGALLKAIGGKATTWSNARQLSHLQLHDIRESIMDIGVKSR